jgi:zeaxanthin glucosyltransferase
MSRLVFLSLPGTGHLNPLTALGRRLQQRGHEVIVFQIADAEPLIRESGLDFVQIGQKEFPEGALRKHVQKLSRLSGLDALRYTTERICANSAMILNDAPSAVLRAKIEVLIVDQAEFAGGTVAEHLRLPFLSVAVAMPINLEPNVPFFAFNWHYGTGMLYKFRNQLGNAFIQNLARPVRRVINQYRERWHLRTVDQINEFFSKLAPD